MTIQSDKVTLFIVEDDEIDFMTIERTMKRMQSNNPVIRAVDGQAALDQLHAKQIHRPFVMLLDLKIPKISGLELLKLLRKMPDFKDTVVFILSSSSDEKDIKASYQQNVAGYFVKSDIDNEFTDILTLLHGYWRTAHIPE